jgi:hypothetical protein
LEWGVHGTLRGTSLYYSYVEKIWQENCAATRGATRNARLTEAQAQRATETTTCRNTNNRNRKPQPATNRNQLFLHAV